VHVSPLYQIKLECVYCGKSFQTSKVRPSFKKVLRVDTDFCIYYKDLNPDYYLVRVCPYCGYAGTENSPKSLSPAQRHVFKEKITDRWTMRNYGDERNWEEALQTYQIALLCAQATNEADRVIAGLLHRIAWMYRYRQFEEQERRFLRYALETYMNVYEREVADLNHARLMYLIGELNRRLGDHQEAVRWFSRIVNDRRIMDASIIRAARMQWETIRNGTKV